MAALTHISMWDEKHGWQRTTAAEARAVYPAGLTRAVVSKQFLCEICGQYANFIAGEYQQPHFRHNRNSNDCEQKLTSNGYYYITNPRGFSLPLKVKISNSSVDVSIGFLPISENDLQILSKTNGQLLIKANSEEICLYNISTSRFSSEHITYLSVGKSLAEEYRLIYPDTVKKMNIFWPTVVNGFSEQGTLFDYDSGKRLPRNANVIVGKTYLLFLNQRTYLPQSSEVVIIKEYVIGNYSIYKVSATKISHTADEFFRRYGCRLTDNPAILTLLYPFAVNTSHVITHTADKVWFHKTNGIVEVYPQNHKPTSDIFSVNSGFQQILSLSRFENNTSVLRYMMLRKVQYITYPDRSINVDVRNYYNESIIANEYTTLPPNREIHITSEFDGYVEVRNGDFTVNRIALKSGVKTIIDVDFNRRYRIRQGLDFIYEVSYIRKEQTHSFSDDEMLARLQNFKGEPIAVLPSLGVIADRLTGLPKTALWFRRQIANGKINRRAKQILQNL